LARKQGSGFSGIPSQLHGFRKNPQNSACVRAMISRESSAMDSFLQIELTTHERDILLRGLRYVRSAIMLEQREPSVNDRLRRSEQLEQVIDLSQRLESTDPLNASV
jgi:hypothetical protein